MRKNHLALACLCLVASLAPLPSHAETLDDASIRGLYADAAAAIRDPDKTRQIMEARLDENYTLKSNTSQTVENSPPKTSTEKYNKTEAIHSIMASYSIVRMEAYQNKVVDIKFSEDRKYALVTDTTASSGTMNIPTEGGHIVSAHYEAGEGCVDKVALVGTTIKIMQSACNDQFNIKK